VPPFFSITADATLYDMASVRYVGFRVARDLSYDMGAWIAGPHPTTPSVGPIVQLIFAFPRASYDALVRETGSDALSSFLEGRVYPRPGTVTALPGGVPQSVLARTSIGQVSTRAGNVGGVTGYYIYSGAGAVWLDGQVVFVPEQVVRLMPRLPDGLIEYSFYGSEAYCLVQRTRVPNLFT
jgi:hypothetical protein